MFGQESRQKKRLKEIERLIIFKNAEVIDLKVEYAQIHEELHGQRKNPPSHE